MHRLAGSMVAIVSAFLQCSGCKLLACSLVPLAACARTHAGAASHVVHDRCPGSAGGKVICPVCRHCVLFVQQLASPARLTCGACGAPAQQAAAAFGPWSLCFQALVRHNDVVLVGPSPWKQV